MSHVAIGNFLKGQAPKSEHLAELAEYFEVTMDSLYWPDREKAEDLLREKPPEYLIDDAVAEALEIREKVKSLEIKLKKMKGC